MKTWVRKTLSVGVLAAGALLFAPGAAHAGAAQDTSDNNGILNGTQLVAPVSIPLNVVGTAIGVAGEANAAGAGQNWTESGWGPDQDSHDNNGIGNGTQLYLPINVPVNVVGTAVGVLGEANAAGVGVNGHDRGRKESAHVTGHGHPNQGTSDNNGILNGTQIYSPIDIPINICGTSLALLGEANSQALCVNHGHGRSESGWAADQDSHDNNGILNGTQVYAPISLPLNLAGTAVGVLGEGHAAGAAANESAVDHPFDQNSHDNNGILNGTQIAAPIHVPVNICGTALGILGEANATAACSNGDLGGFGGTNGNGHHGHGHGHGHGNGNGGANGNAGDNGDNYPSGGSNGHHDTGLMGDHGALGNSNGAYGGQGRMAATEASPVDSLTQGVGGVGTTNLGGLDLLNTLR